MDKPRIATLWLDGCSGCHMSLLDMDERLLEIAGKIELVYSPVADAKEFPDNVDLTLVEAPSPSDEDLEKIKRVRKQTQNAGCARRLRCNRQCSRHAQQLCARRRSHTGLCRKRNR